MAWRQARRILLLLGTLLALRLALAWAWPLVLAVVLAALLEAPVARLSRASGMGRAGAAAAVVGAGVLLGLGLAGYLIAHLVPEVAALQALTPVLVRDMRRGVAGVVGSLGPPGAWPEPLRTALRSETAAAGRALSAAAVAALTGLTVLPGLAAGLGLAVVAAYLILVDGPLGDRVAAGFADVPLVRQGLDTLSVAARGAWRLASAELLLAGLSALFSSLAFLLLGARVPLVLGLLAGLLDLIPYAGPAALLIPWAAYLALTGAVGRCLLVLGAWLALAAVRGVLELRWVGRGIGLSTLAVLVSFYVGARAMGIAGILVGPVCAAAVWAVWREGRSEAPGLAPLGPRRRRPRAIRVWLAATRRRAV